MKKARSQSVTNGMRDQYDFKRGTRGMYAHRYTRGSNVVVLEPDVAKLFSDSDKVNRSLRAMAGLADPHRKGSSGQLPGNSARKARQEVREVISRWPVLPRSTSKLTCRWPRQRTAVR